MERKEAIEVIKKNWLDNSNSMLREALETLIPELKENDDERIRKALIQVFNVENFEGYDIKNEEVIAWLEKQGEYAKFRNKIQIGDKVTRSEDGVLVNISQLNRIAKKRKKQGEKESNSYCEENCKGYQETGKCYADGDCEAKRNAEQMSTDNAKPKFKVGDWITNDTCTWKIEFIEDDLYYQTYCDIECGGDIESIDKEYHLWTIQDAKAGDVLATENGRPFIFKGLSDKFHPQSPVAYCGIDSDDEFFIPSGIGWWTDDEVCPATKEQRERLEKAIAEAGYKWDVKKKELKKINNEEIDGEDYGIDGLWHAQRILEETLGSVDGYQTDDGILEHKAAITAVKKLYGQKLSWSEEDKKMIDVVIDAIGVADYYTHDDKQEIENWLKTLKDRVLPQPEQEWSEEDDKKINYLIALLQNSTMHNSALRVANEEIENWLKLLRPLNRWKPSDEQMEVLYRYAEQNSYDGAVLISLYNDIKKLKE